MIGWSCIYDSSFIQSSSETFNKNYTLLFKIFREICCMQKIPDISCPIESCKIHQSGMGHSGKLRKIQFVSKLWMIQGALDKIGVQPEMPSHFQFRSYCLNLPSHPQKCYGLEGNNILECLECWIHKLSIFAYTYSTGLKISWMGRFVYLLENQGKTQCFTTWYPPDNLDYIIFNNYSVGLVLMGDEIQNINPSDSTFLSSWQATVPFSYRNVKNGSWAFPFAQAESCLFPLSELFAFLHYS